MFSETHARFYRGLALSPLMALMVSPAMAQAAPEPAGLFNRLFDFSWQPGWYSALVALGCLVAGSVAAWLWYRFALEQDLNADRTPASTRISSLGLAIVIFAAVFTLVAPAGIGWFIVIALVGIVIMAVGRAVLLVGVVGILMLIFIIARIYNLI